MFFPSSSPIRHCFSEDSEAVALPVFRHPQSSRATPPKTPDPSHPAALAFMVTTSGAIFAGAVEVPITTTQPSKISRLAPMSSNVCKQFPHYISAHFRE